MARLSRPTAVTAGAGGTSSARVLTRDAVLWRAEQTVEERRSGATHHGGDDPLCMPSACELRWLGARPAALGGLLVSVETPVRTSDRCPWTPPPHMWDGAARALFGA